MYIEVKGKLTGANEYINACRRNVYSANNLKKNNEKIVKVAIMEALKKGTLNAVRSYPCKLKISWYEPNRKRDVDNISFAVKFILDALVDAGIIPNDSQKYVDQVINSVHCDKDNPRIEIRIFENELQSYVV